MRSKSGINVLKIVELFANRGKLLKSSNEVNRSASILILVIS